MQRQNSFFKSKTSYKRRRSTYKPENIFFKIMRLILILIVVIIIGHAVLITTFLQTIQITTESMSPSIMKHEKVFVSPLPYKLVLPGIGVISEYHEPEVGDIVLLRPNYVEPTPFLEGVLNFLVTPFSLGQPPPTRKNNFQPQNLIIRRIIAGPGDAVYMQNGLFYIRLEGGDRFLSEEIFTQTRNYATISDKLLPLGVPFNDGLELRIMGDDEWFVAADHRIGSTDSRHWGPINSNQIVGKVLLRYFPFNKIGLID